MQYLLNGRRERCSEWTGTQGRYERRRTTPSRGVAGSEAGMRFQVAELTDLPFADGYFDAVLSAARCSISRMTSSTSTTWSGELWRVLGAEGVFFARLASIIGDRSAWPERATQAGSAGRSADTRIPDGSERFCVDLAFLLGGERAMLGAEPLDPIKTTNVQNRSAP